MSTSTNFAAETLAALVDFAPDGLMVLTQDGEIRFINRAGAQLLGHSSAELVGSHFGVPLTADGATEITIAPIGRREAPGVCELRVSTMLADFDNSYVVSLRDVSALKHAENEAYEARAVAEAAEVAKTQLLWRTSHELRTPLSALVGFADLLSHSQLDELQADWVSRIMAAGQHLREVTDDVLSTAEIASGKIRTEMQPVKLCAAVQDVVDLLQNTAFNAGVRFVVNLKISPLLHVKADPQRLRQVLLNLLSNAVKYNGDSATVEIGMHAQGSDYARVRITDHGRGMDPEQLARLFVPFDRLGVENSGIPGTGLGLVVAKAMVEAMGGKIGAESQTSSGSTFWIDLPRIKQ